MKFLIEIASPRGKRACKEYDAPSLRSAIRAVEFELRNYPGFIIIDIKPTQSMPQFVLGEEW
jgi:hypothetical protein